MRVSNRDHRFQNLPRTISYSGTQRAFINSLTPFQGGEWDKPLTGTGRPHGAQARRNELRNSIRNKLNNIQYPHCIYCGFHEKIVGYLQRDHIAPKELYQNFVFEEENLVLACANCNGFLRKSSYDTVSVANVVYSRCKFKIIHPYRDRYQHHLNFRFSNNNLFIYSKKYSRKGKNTIRLFGLDDVRHTSIRGAAIIKKNIRLTPAQEARVQAAIARDYVT
jgi:uncharacterized protein (TIGR02646 family)